MWAGGVIGVVAGGMISFIVFKIAVMLFTSLGGGAITLVGILSLLHHYETKMVEPPTTNIHTLLSKIHLLCIPKRYRVNR